MTITASGYISLSNIQTEFGGTNPIWMSEYYTNNASGYTTGISGLPASGTTMNISNFYGKSKTLPAPVASVSGCLISPLFGMTPTNGFQSNFWFNTTAVGAGLMTIMITDYTNTRAGLNIFVDGAGKFAAYLRYSNNSIFWQTSSSQSINDGTWHNVHIKYAYSSLTISVDNGTFCSFTCSGYGSILEDQAYSGYTIDLNYNYASILYALVYFDYNHPGVSATTFYSSTSKAVNNTGTGNNIDGAGSSPIVWLKNSGSNFYVNAGGNFSIYGTAPTTTTNTSLTY